MSKVRSSCTLWYDISGQQYTSKHYYRAGCVVADIDSLPYETLNSAMPIKNERCRKVNGLNHFVQTSLFPTNSYTSNDSLDAVNLQQK